MSIKLFQSKADSNTWTVAEIYKMIRDRAAGAEDYLLLGDVGIHHASADAWIIGDLFFS
jgi:hypothetical protein